jgi:hypothetical protein
MAAIAAGACGAGTAPVRQPAPRPRVPPFNRIAYSAAHVVADPLAAIDPWLQSAVDWDATIAYRRACGRWAWAWPRPWTRPSAAWGWTGPRRWS